MVEVKEDFIFESDFVSTHARRDAQRGAHHHPTLPILFFVLKPTVHPLSQRPKFQARITDNSIDITHTQW